MEQVWGTEFIGARQSNYGDALMDIRVGMEIEWDERLKSIVRGNWVINPWGRRNKFLGLDEFMEELVRNLKDIYSPGSSDVLESFAREVTSRNIIYFMRVKEEMRLGMGMRRHSGNHVKQDRSGDVLALVDCLLDEQVMKFIEGRGVVSGIKAVEDMDERGQERMNDGEWWYEYLMRSPGCARALRLSGHSLWARELPAEQYGGSLL